jgi:tetratricopeptide (TPR) repeat protein
LGLWYSRRSESRHQISKAAIQRAAAAKRWNAVESGLRDWLQAHPDDGDAWEMLGGVLLDRGRPYEALAALERVRVADPGWGHAQTLIGEIAVRHHNLPLAELTFRRAAARDPRAVEPLKRLSSLLVLERRTWEARNVLRRLFWITRDPRFLADSFLVFQLESEVHDLGPELEEYLHQTPDDPWLRRVSGLYLLSHGRAAEALPHLEAAAELFDSDLVGRFALAECRMAVGIAGDDLSILGKRPDRAVDAAHWWVLRSRLAEAWGKDAEVLPNLREAVAVDPRNAEAQFRLGQALSRRGEREEAQVYLDRAQALGLRDDRLKRELRRVVRERVDRSVLSSISQLCQDAGMVSDAKLWRALAGGHPDRRLLGYFSNPTHEDDGPSVALSRPVLKSSRTQARRKPAGHTTSTQRPSPRLEDIAEPSGIHYHYNPGATPNLFIGDTMGGGVALVDFDEDGWLDIYFVNGCALPHDRQSPSRPNKLYRNRGDGTFEDVTELAGVPGRGYGMGCTVGDFDDDGHDDLFVTGLNETILYRNRGDGTFEDLTASAGVTSSRWTTAAGFGDLDGDGDLDLMVVTYVDARVEDRIECRDRAGRLIHCNPDRFPAQLDQLFRNNGDGTFTDVSKDAGIEIPDGKGLGLALADFDEDGRLDLFVANDGTPNFLFRNLGDMRFEEVGASAGAAYDASGQPTASMGVVAEDLNEDGRIDLFHTNFIDQTSTMRWNLGGGQFTDGTLASNLAAPSRAMTGFGAVALDVDNDGHLDLFVANGHTDDQPWVNIPMAQAAQLFWGREFGRFDLAPADSVRILAQPAVGRGVAAGDLDNDGRVDIVVVDRDRPAVILRNETQGGHWLGVRLLGNRSGRSPIGARVTCQVGGRSIVRWLTSGTSYLSCSESRLWFGLGAAKLVDAIEVRWPSGMAQSRPDIPADQVIDVREDDASTGH